MSACCCLYDTGEGYDYTEEAVVPAETGTVCCECRRAIPTGAPHLLELCWDCWDWCEGEPLEGEEPDRHHTCLLCRAVRVDRFSCGWCYGSIWNDLSHCAEDELDDDDEFVGWLDPPTHPIDPKTGF